MVCGGHHCGEGVHARLQIFVLSHHIWVQVLFETHLSEWLVPSNDYCRTLLRVEDRHLRLVVYLGHVVCSGDDAVNLLLR